MATDEENSKSADTSFSEVANESIKSIGDYELYLEIENINKQNAIMEGETQMYENFLRRIEDAGELVTTTKQPLTHGPNSSSETTLSSYDKPNNYKKESTIPESAGSETVSNTGESVGPLMQMTHRNSKKRSRSKSYSSEDKANKLNYEMKFSIAQKEAQNQRKLLDNIKIQTEKKIEDLKASIEELDIRVIDNQKIHLELAREINRSNKAERGKNNIYASKIIKFISDKGRKEDSLIEKLRLKNASLAVQKRKFANNLLQKEAMGEILHEVDFSQLKIENQQYMAKIEELNQDLLTLKLMTGNTLQTLNVHKKKLNQCSLQLNQVDSEINLRVDLIDRIDKEQKQVEIELIKTEQTNKNLKNKLVLYKVPSVKDYVELNSKIYQINKDINIWNRKVAIAKMDYNSLIKSTRM